MSENKMSRRHVAGGGIAAAALPLFGARASAQRAWPSKPVRIVVGSPVGGQVDIIARAYGEFLSRHFGQPFVADNKAGASGSVAAIDVKHSAPDGHTVMCTLSTTMIQNRVTIKNLAYNPDKDFSIFSAIKSGGFPMVVQSSSGVTNLKEFVEFARKADKVSMGSYALGSTAHMVAVELSKQYNLKMEPIQYRGEAAMWQDFLAGVLDAGLGSYVQVAGVVATGRGRIIGSTGGRLKPLPDIPTLAEQGASSTLFGVRGFNGWWAPAGTPPDILKRLSDAMVLGAKDERVMRALESSFLEPASDMAEAQRQYAMEAPALLAAMTELGIKGE